MWGKRRRATLSFTDRGDGLAGSHTEPALTHPNGYAACWVIVLAGRTRLPVAMRF
jgi:hypothetical protein